MISSSALKALLICALPLTLTIKVVAAHPVPPDDMAVPEAVAGFVSHHAYEARIIGRTKQFVEAKGNGCHLLILEVQPEGWSNDAVSAVQSQLGLTEDRVSYVYRGRVYDEQPTYFTVPQDIWTRFQRRLGIAAERHPVLAVSAPRECPIEHLPWDEVFRLS